MSSLFLGIFLNFVIIFDFEGLLFSSGWILWRKFYGKGGLLKRWGIGGEFFLVLESFFRAESGHFYFGHRLCQWGNLLSKNGGSLLTKWFFINKGVFSGEFALI